MNKYYDWVTIVLAITACIIIALTLMAQQCSQKAQQIEEFNQIMLKY